MPPQLWHPSMGSPKQPTLQVAKTNTTNNNMQPVYFPYCTVVKKLGILKLNDIYTLQQLKFYYKLLHLLLPYYFYKMSYVTNIQKHGINTRASNNLHVQRFNHEFAKHCIRFRLVQTVNTMPNLIIHKLQTHSLYGFSSYDKQYFITNYEHSCNITDCYVCNRLII